MISAVTPFYNERGVLEEAVARFSGSLEKLGDRWEWILVDDGSTDGSGDLARALARHDPRIRVVSRGEHRGRGYAIRQGVAMASGEIVVTAEIDGTWGDDIVSSLVQVLRQDPDCDIAVASPHVAGGDMQNVPLYRRLLSRWGNYLTRVILRTGVTMNTGMTRAYRREKFMALPLFREGKETHVEIIAKSKAAGYKITEIPARVDWKRAGIGAAARRRSSLKLMRDVWAHLVLLVTLGPRKGVALALPLLILGASAATKLLQTREGWIEASERGVPGIILGLMDGDPNPHFFRHPSLAYYANLAAFWVHHLLDGSPGGFFEPARAATFWLDREADGLRVMRLTAFLFGTAVPVMVFLAGLRWAGMWAGVVAASFCMSSGTLLYYAHNGSYVSTATFFLSAAVLGIVQAALKQEQKSGSWLVVGFLAGLAATTSYNAGVVTVAALAAATMHGHGSGRVFRRVGCILIGTVTAFLAGTPGLLLTPGEFLEDVTHQLGVPGRVLWPQQGLDYFLRVYIMGHADVVIQLLGLTAALRLALRGGLGRALIAIPCFGLLPFWFMRSQHPSWIAPVVPVMCLFIGAWFAGLMKRGGSRSRAVVLGGWVLLLALCVFGRRSGLWSEDYALVDYQKVEDFVWGRLHSGESVVARRGELPRFEAAFKFYADGLSREPLSDALRDELARRYGWNNVVLVDTRDPRIIGLQRARKNSTLLVGPAARLASSLALDDAREIGRLSVRLASGRSYEVPIVQVPAGRGPSADTPISIPREQIEKAFRVGPEAWEISP